MYLFTSLIMRMKKPLRANWSMENIGNTVFLIDIYNKFSSDKIISTFKINNREYCIKEVELMWGMPILNSIEEEAEQPYFKLYNTLDEAKEYVKQLKQLEGARF